TGKPVEQIKEDTERDYFMSPQQSLDYGIIDEVLTNKKTESSEG
ncbi:MAG: ATP-dependent Clp protease proteolytic subunit, partial [Myxococcota bacterium]